jgi:hypothetical protein
MEFQFCSPAFIPLPNIPLPDVPQAGASCRDAAVRISLCQLCVFTALRLCVEFRRGFLPKSGGDRIGRRWMLSDC